MKLAHHLQQGKVIYLLHAHSLISVSENRHFRWLEIDGVVQSVMNKRKPQTLSLPHHYFMMLPLCFYTPTHVVELGLGGGDISRFLTRFIQPQQLSIFEKDREIISTYRQFFTQDQSINVINSDALLWLLKHREYLPSWTIIDIFQRSHQQARHLNEITTTLCNLPRDAWLTLNLPSFSASAINTMLKQLSQHALHHQVIYFHVPHYNNLVIHCLPTSISFSENTLLPSYLIKRGQSLWQHRHTLR